MAKLKKTGKIAGKYIMVRPEDVVANPKNVNRESSFTFAKLVESILEFGFTDPIIVREKDDALEVVGGEHRLRAAKVTGMEEIPAINLGPISDLTANRLLIVLNETKGAADPDSLAAMVQAIREEGGDDALQVLPFNDAQLADLLDDLGDEHVFDDDEMPAEEDVKAAKIKPSDVAAALELEGTKQPDLLQIINAIRAWRADKDAKVPAWRHLLNLIEK
jgi:ParB-like chromosome segregation protein Spo0J